MDSWYVRYRPPQPSPHRQMRSALSIKRRLLEEPVDDDTTKVLLPRRPIHPPDTKWVYSANSPEDIRIDACGQWTRGMCVIDRRNRPRRPIHPPDTIASAATQPETMITRALLLTFDAVSVRLVRFDIRRPEVGLLGELT
jgi:hypothetical protein